MAGKADFGKNILIGGIVAGVLAVGLSFLNPDTPQYSAKKLQDKASDSFRGEKEAKLWVDSINNELAFNKKTHQIEDNKPAVEVYTTKTDKETIKRLRPLFVAAELWETEEHGVIDLYKESAEGKDIHPGISNYWFKKNDMFDALCVSNGPDQDPDGDGFSNREEYVENSSPKDVNSTPPLVSPAYIKLNVTETNKTKVTVRMVQAIGAEGEKMVRVRRYRKGDEEIAPDKKIELKKGDTFGIDTKQPNLFEINDITDADPATNKPALVFVRNTVTNEELISFKYDKAGQKPLSYETASFVITAGAHKGKIVGPFMVGREFEIEGMDGYKFKIEAVNGAPEGTKSSKPKKNKKNKKKTKDAAEAQPVAEEENAVEGTVQLVVIPKNGGDEYTVTVQKASEQAAQAPQTDTNQQ